MLLDEEEDGAPPRSTVDLTAGQAVIRVPGDRRAPRQSSGLPAIGGRPPEDRGSQVPWSAAP